MSPAPLFNAISIKSNVYQKSIKTILTGCRCDDKISVSKQTNVKFNTT